MKKELLLILVSLFLVTGLFASGEAEGTDTKDIQKITIWTDNYDKEPPKADLPGELWLESLTNTSLDINYIPASVYNEKANIAIASGDMPDAFLIRQTKDATYLQAAKNGVFWALDDVLKKYAPTIANSPNLKAGFTNSKVNGITYGIPRERQVARMAVLYRDDWLKNLGLDFPKNWDELLNVMRAFTFDDPDGNGKDDTIGFVTGKAGNQAEIPFDGFRNAVVMNGGPNAWGVEKGKVVPDFTTDGYTRALDFYRTMYKEGLMNSDFPVLDREEILSVFGSGRAGMAFTILADPTGRDWSQKILQSGGSWSIKATIPGPEGERMKGQRGFFGVYAFPKSSVADEKELQGIVEFFEKFNNTPEVQKKCYYGVEGRHYTLENGFMKKTEDQVALKNAEGYGALARLIILFAHPKQDLPERDQLYDDLMNEWNPKATVSAVEPFVSNTYIEKQSTLLPIINDATIKYIMGIIDRPGFEDAISEWKKNGGDDVTAEYQAQYDAAN